MPVIKSRFRPAWWLRGAHAQTLWSSLFRRKPKLTIEWQRAAAMSVPFLLDQSARRMNQGLSRIYQRHLVGSMQQSYKEKYAGSPSPLDIDIDALRMFWQFDDQVTAPLHGFKGADDYYTRSSSRQFIPRIRVPTLILHAVDDPFMFSHTPPQAEELPENVWLELPEHGGHVGFISGIIPGLANYWGEKRLAEWIDSA